MIDGNGRLIDYLRISVTDKCNLRCKYCMPSGGINLMPHEEILTLEEIYRVVSVMAKLGIKKVRFTGGEPLVRKNLTKLIGDINVIPGIEEISMTTNGILFADMAQDLKTAGLKSVNISLDTLDSDRFTQITGVNGVESVLASVDAALNEGLKVKINSVLCREFNEQDILALANIAKERNIDVRFIELMPIGCGKDFTGISSDEIMNKLENNFGKAKIFAGKVGNGPAVYYEFEGFAGKIGFISPMSHKFCSECNRVRLTCDGDLKLCLHYNKGIDLKEILRSGCSDSELLNVIKDAVMRKPKEHGFDIDNQNDVEVIKDADSRRMSQIGG